MLDVLVIGAGPAGLSVSIEAKKSNLKYVILDKGSVVNTICRFPTEMVFFSTPELLEIGGVPFVISNFRPTRIEAVNYYQRVVGHYGILVSQYDTVSDVQKMRDHFLVRSSKGEYKARNIVVATGYYDSPTRLKVKGENLDKVSHYFEDPYPYYRCDVAVVGGKNSAVETALSLFRHGARVSLIHRGRALSKGVKSWILPDFENRVKEGSIRAFFRSRVREIQDNSILLQDNKNQTRRLKNDFVFIQIGYTPNVDLLRSLGVKIDKVSSVPRHRLKTMETNIKGVYIAGSLAAGINNNKIFIENGRLHGRLIINSIVSRGRK